MTDIIDEYKTLGSNVSEGFYSEKRSKFFAFAMHVESEEEIHKIVAQYKKKYYDARHVCYAYVLDTNRERFRANDDGEPCSTAGKPILGQINKRELTNVLVIVVRYYGGVNLGTGGLIVAYRSAAEDALEKANIEICQIEEIVSFSFLYPMMNSVMRVIKDMSPRILSQHYDNTCEIKLSISKSKASILRNRLEKLSFEG